MQRTVTTSDIQSIEDLEHYLSAPTLGVTEAMKSIPGNILVLGVGGKMGPTLAMMAKRASDEAGVSRRVIGVARFSEEGLEDRLQQAGIETIRCDLLNHDELNALPDAPNIIYMAGMKFGSTGNEGLTWAMNCYLPGMVCERFPKSRISAFSTGNVYHLVPVEKGGSVETDPLNAQGDYAMSCVGRERMFQHFSQTQGTPVILIRLNYAAEQRYGVLVDIGMKVWTGQPVDLTTGYLNCIWQPEANAMVIMSIQRANSPAEILNVTGPENMSIRKLAEDFGALMDKTPEFSGTESPEAFLSNTSKSFEWFGKPQVTREEMIKITAEWIMNDGAMLDKPTHFETRDGEF